MKRALLSPMKEHAIYACNTALSRGRLFDTSASPTRSEFQRDRDRIIHSTAFRRLQHKTQVFLHHEGQHFRTRLTHTLEVSQIARSIARALKVDEDLAEAVALAHDLGHPPFGHAGERVLNEKMAEWGGFDHNIQTLRTITLLENRYAEHDGLNLTWETLEGILKHNGPMLDHKGDPVGKYARDGLPWGFDFIPAVADLELNTYASIEAQIAAIADDIAYNSHDLDDALRAQILDLEALSDVALIGPIVQEVLARWPDIDRSRQAHEVQRRLITRMIEDVIHTSLSNIEQAAPNSATDVRNSKQTLVAFSNGVAEAELELKRYLFENVYRSKPVMTNVTAGEGVVARLFDYLLKTPDLPDDWKKAATNAPDANRRARVICDFVAGMTDPYALDLYQRLFDARPEFR